MAKKDGDFPALTGLRAVAAALVYFHHFFTQYRTPENAWEKFLAAGSLGVFVFFTLSGFLITKIYYARFASGTVRLRDYFFRRFARIYPVYLFLLLAKYAAYPGSAHSAAQVAANLTFTQAYFPDFTWTGLFPAWSLGVEEFFYASAPLVYFVLRKSASKARSRPAVPSKSATLAILLSLCVAFPYAFDFLHDLKLGHFLENPNESFYFSIFFCWPFFSAGIFTGLFYGRAPARKGVPKSTRRLAELAFVSSAAALLASIGAIEDLAGSTLAAAVSNSYIWAVGLSTALMIWAIVNRSRLAEAALGNRVAVYLGKISYLVYLLQEFFFGRKINAKLEQMVPHWLSSFTLFYYLIISAVAMVLYELLERPVHSWLIRQIPTPAAAYDPSERAKTSKRRKVSSRRV